MSYFFQHYNTSKNTIYHLYLQYATLTLAISPCPNDTFIFDAMLHNHKIDTEGFEFILKLRM